jgi:hypothetical protein
LDWPNAVGKTISTCAEGKKGMIYMLKIKIDFKSFFQKGTKNISDNFGIFLITGYQGSGKTWYSIYLMEKEKNKKIYTNIKSYTSTRNDVHYFDKIEDIVSNVEDNCIFLIDEISKKYTKDTKQDLKFYSWLQQSRKHQRYVYLITQEYIQVPTWLRGVANQVYTTSKVPIFPIFKTSLGIPVLNENYEWDIQELAVIFYKRTKKISNLYDTYESINNL